MKLETRNSKLDLDDPELELQRDEGMHVGLIGLAIAWVAVQAIRIWSAGAAVGRWTRARAARWAWRLTTLEECSWCNRLIRVPWILTSNPRRSHGICAGCLRTKKDEWRLQAAAQANERRLLTTETERTQRGENEA